MFNVTEYEAESREAGERKEKEGRGARVRAYHFFLYFLYTSFWAADGRRCANTFRETKEIPHQPATPR